MEPNFYASVICINPFGEVLLGRRNEDGKYTPPGGSANEGETPERTATRELFEEAGIVALPHQLKRLPEIATTNGKICHCYLFVTDQQPDSSLDPDEEVDKWKWYAKDQLPEGLKKDPRRHESVRNALMSFHGITKGGPGSGPKPGKITKQPWDDSVKDTPEYDARLAQRKEDKIKRQLDQAKLEYKLKFGKDYEPVKKGGPGSGVDGHKTFKPTQSNVSSLADKLADPNPFKSHLHKLKTGSSFEGAELKSGKPVYTSTDQAMAHGYSQEDYNEAANFNWDKMQSMNDQIQKIKALGKDVPHEMKDIMKFHERQFKANHQMSETVAKRHAKTGKAIDHKKDISNTIAAVNKKLMTKSVVMMGQQDAAEVDTGKFANEHGKNLDGWQEHIQNCMADYNYGDTPREISIDKGTLFLTKVDDGMYSGYVRLTHNQMEDNAKVRIERMTIPSLSQFLLAKEYVLPGPSIAGNSPGNNNMMTGGEMTLAMPEPMAAADSMNTMDLEPFSESMTPAPIVEQPMPKVESSLDKKIMILQLIDKLIS